MQFRAAGERFLRYTELVSPFLDGEPKTTFYVRFSLAFDALIGVQMQTLRLQDLSDNFSIL